MRFEGRIRKDGRLWLVEVPAFDAITQGRTKREALEMAEDLLETMADVEGFRVTATSTGRETFEIGANQLGVLLALLLRRQRERQGLTLAQAAFLAGLPQLPAVSPFSSSPRATISRSEVSPRTNTL